MHNKRYEIDMLHGKMIPLMISFALPLIATSVLQLLYNAADVIVVGRFAGANSLAAVGSCSALINLIVNLFLGLSVGTNVLVAKARGAGDYRTVQDLVHTSVTIALAGGVVIGIFGFIMGGTFLSWMGSPEEVLPLASIYIRIYFIGMPFNMLYNFGAAILRAVGDTKHPLYYLTAAGIINVVLNLVFVIVFRMDVAGVALATIISQTVSSILVMICLIRSHGIIHLDLKKLKIERSCLLDLARIGLPAGAQGAFFSISNVLIQSTVNSYGAAVVAANSASSNIEGFVYVAENAFHQAAVTFVAANIGARKNSRIRKAMGSSLILSAGISMLMGGLFVIFKRQLFSIYTNDQSVIDAGCIRITIMLLTYFACGTMEALCGVMRGTGSTVLPMIISVIGSCAFRIFWIYCIHPLFPAGSEQSLYVLYLSYPISWVITSLAHLVCCRFRLRKFPVDLAAEAREELKEN